MIINGIIKQFAEEASFLWFLRNRLVSAPHISLQDLARHDERLEAHIDGLRIAGDEACNICQELLGNDSAEDLFAPAVLAFESNDQTRVQGVIEAAKEDLNKIRVLVSALGWLSFEQAEPHIEKLLTDESPYLRYIGIAASAIHRHDPGHHLDKASADNFPLLAARALRTYGELGTDIRLTNFAFRENLSDNDDGIRFSTAWSATLSGNHEAVDVLKDFVQPDSAYQLKALNVALRLMSQPVAVIFQKKLAESSDTVRIAVVAAGVIGDPSMVPWLIDRMEMPELARVAGEAFTMITGIGNDLEEMQGDCPENFNYGPNDDPADNNVAMDADENLPWPNPGLFVEWWKSHQGNFQAETRHLLGKPVKQENLRHLLKNGLQRQRAGAALDLAILQSGRSLFNINAPGYRQLKEVAGL